MEPKPDDMLRLFFGVLLPPEVRQDVAALQERLAQSKTRVKWVEPENLHVTLRFLGELPAMVLRDLKLLGHKLAAESAPWELQLNGLGAFPKLRQPQVLWLGVGHGAEPLTHLGRCLNQKLEDGLIVARDPKAFHPHCTLGRVKQERGLRELIDLVQQDAGYSSVAFSCDHYQLLCSKLGPSGPEYEMLAEFKLGRRG